MTANREGPGRIFAAVSILPIGLVAYFATKILLVSPGNLLALICLALTGLTAGNVVRRNGIRSLVSAATLVVAVLAVLLALVLNRA